MLCARCTRFSEQVAGDPFIALIERGALQQVGIYEKQPLQSYFSGNTIQICPVGALTSAEYRFRSRPFDLVSVPSIAEHDACGSAIRVDYRRGQVMRRLAGDDPEVNEEWITDKDRFAFALRPRRRPADPAAGPRATATCCGRRRGPRRSTSPSAACRLRCITLDPNVRVAATAEPGRSGRRADRRSADARGRVRVHQVRPRGPRHQQHRLPVPAAQPRRPSSWPTAVRRHRARRHLRRPGERPAVLLVAFEPEDEAGAIFLRLRKAFRKQGLQVATLAPYLSNGAASSARTLVPTVPGRRGRRAGPRCRAT